MQLLLRRSSFFFCKDSSTVKPIYGHRDNTCKRSSGKDQFLFLRESANFALLQSQNYLTNQYKIVNDWLRRWDEENCQVWFRSVLGERLPCEWNIQFYCFFLLVSLIRLHTTIRNGFSCTIGQISSFGVRMCLLSIRSVKIPKIWP